MNFVRSHRRLWGLFHRRYFESSVVPVAGGPRAVGGTVQFGDGWYVAENDESGRPFRWMGGRATLLLQPMARGQLALQFYAPIDAEPVPNVTIVFNDIAVDRFRVTQANFHKTYDLLSRDGRPGRLVIVVDHVVNPAKLGKGGDPRDLGLRVSGISWKGLMP